MEVGCSSGNSSALSGTPRNSLLRDELGDSSAEVGEEEVCGEQFFLSRHNITTNYHHNFVLSIKSVKYIYAKRKCNKVYKLKERNNSSLCYVPINFNFKIRMRMRREHSNSLNTSIQHFGVNK